ncbi:UNVERIFIED_CONTAM: hypothetical protein FKN15_043305 [Acipenser sinensis]
MNRNRNLNLKGRCERVATKGVHYFLKAIFLEQVLKSVESRISKNDSGSLDTVGAIVIDHEGNVAAAVSSGGLAMKHPGRVGQAAHYGCGCWAENAGNLNPYSTAVSTSGCGEHLVRTMLARECSIALQSEDAHHALLETMQNKFISKYCCNITLIFTWL